MPAFQHLSFQRESYFHWVAIFLNTAGEGDAAVSNSIGSNVFDILLGLGLPWFFKAVTDKPVQVRADSLERSVAVLFGIVLVVVAAISLSGWKLTRLIGVVFFLVYIGFVVMELALAA